jgi:PleD family two-component response regulator
VSMEKSRKNSEQMSADDLLSKLEDFSKPADILIVDDVYANVFLVENILPEEFTADSVTSAEEMWRYVRVKLPRLILLDLMMPFEDGFEVLKKLGADDRLKKIPVIVLSAKDTKEDVVRAMKLGAVDYIVKPVDEKSLLKKVRKVLRVSE